MDWRKRPLGDGSPDSSCVGGHGVGREVEDVGVATGGENYGMSRVAGHFSGDQVSDHDPDGLAVLDHQVEHLRAGVDLDLAEIHLTH